VVSFSLDVRRALSLDRCWWARVRPSPSQSPNRWFARVTSSLASRKNAQQMEDW